MRWGWPALLATLLTAGVLLSWADSTLWSGLFPQPFAAGRVERSIVGPAPIPPIGLGAPPPGARVFRGFGYAGGIYTIWWFLAAAAAFGLVVIATVVSFPRRVRQAGSRLQPATLSVFFAAGVVTVVLVAAVTQLIRVTIVLLSFVPIVWCIALLGVLFGVASLALFVGRGLSRRLGPAHPVVAILGAVLLLIDVALVPVAGWVALAVVALTGLGVAVVTRLGSDNGWSLEDLNW
jgi:hypothetical protein